MSAPVEPLLSVRGLVKEFGGNRVLDGVDYDVRPGEVHALLGENGAGKSTLIKVVAGIEPATAGSIEVRGRPLSAHPSARELREAGIAFVHQDLGLTDSLSVAENIALPDRFARGRGGLISFRRTNARARELLAQLDVALDPETLVGHLHQDEKVLVAVARAFSLDAQVIVLDEVSASLPTPEFERFAEAIRRSTQAGIGYVYVTHRLDEVFDLAHRVTVLRDGRVAGCAEVASVRHEQVVEWIIGRSAAPPAPRAAVGGGATPREPALRVEELSGGGLEQPVSFTVAPGEIVAFCGLVGSGARAVAQLLGGALAPAGGGAALAGRELPLGQPHRLVQAGVAYVPGDRDREGALGDLTIRENLFVAAEPDGSEAPRLLRLPGPERARARGLVERFGVRPSDDVDRVLATLSGGNRQKVVVARAMRRRPRLLVLDDPTQGVDVGSRAELHALMRQATAAGMAIVFVSSDFDEVAAEADRAFVTCQGRVACELKGAELTSERLAHESYRDVTASAEMETVR